jgi:acetyl-CoA carboxylase carboxyltransferase component
MTKLNEELDTRTKEAIHIDAKYRELSKKRDKLLPRDRVNAILDPGSPFLEMS